MGHGKELRLFYECTGKPLEIFIRGVVQSDFKKIDLQDSHYCLGSDFYFLPVIITGILRGPSAAFLA